MLHIHLIYNPSRALKLSPKLRACAKLITEVFSATHCLHYKPRYVIISEHKTLEES
jgi:hypothetical protein